MVYRTVNSYIYCFMNTTPAARNFDLLYSKPGEDYQISWQKLNGISSDLPGLIESESHVEFLQTRDQILDGVRAAIRTTDEANALIFFSRICRKF